MTWRERALWIVACAGTTLFGVGQTLRLDDAKSELQRLQYEGTWPARASPAQVAEPTPAAFKKGVRKSIPEEFWGEFATDIHDCGSEQSMIVAGGRISAGNSEGEAINRVDWRQPLKMTIWSSDSSGYDREYRIEASQDRAELTFIYTNRKEIYQRCSVRAHDGNGETSRMTPSIATPDVTREVDEAMAADANMAMNVDVTPDE